jgi:hypothetical protein
LYTTTSETDPFVYLAIDRYTQEAFYSVIIDTSASKRSIAGYSQYLAYLKANPAIELDTTTAGAMNV